MTIHFLTETTKKCANFLHVLLVLCFFNYFLLIFQISISQWLKCRNLKDEINSSHHGGVVVYVLKSELSRSSLKYDIMKKTEKNYDPKIETVKCLELIDLNIIWLIFNTESKGCKFTGHASSHSIFNTFHQISYF